MSTGAALIENVAQAIQIAFVHSATMIPSTWEPEAKAAIEAIGIPFAVLSWCRANPEAAKGLADGTRKAVQFIMRERPPFVFDDEADRETDRKAGAIKPFTTERAAPSGNVRQLAQRLGWEPCRRTDCDYSFEKYGRGCSRCGLLVQDFGD